MTRRGLLDTSLVIDYPAEKVAAVVDEVAVAAISVGELEYGVTAAKDPVVQVQRRHALQAVTAAFDVLPFDADCAEYYGALASAVRAAGRDPRPRRLDLQIAATAVRYGLVLLTRNADDFKGIEESLVVQDLLAPSRS
ncbi:type II toxin-antitoxin system VapC family toxin [Prauserella halophila]|uniref:type II toxin-antitoxin system VapC family toxin n=1 Tax=Prauserella halophila TaxID=185641 RepID=UPI0020A5AF0F|nr:type II toxin-antitoxin system VapC family toxin [Prauserella halophila]